MSKIFIACGGYAQSGKNLFSTLLRERLKLRYPLLTYSEFALAGQLKKDLEPFVKETYGIDIFNCTPEEKELIRPLMVFHGKIKRVRTEGRYWIELLDKQIKECNSDVIAVTDLRYDSFPRDEVFWAQEELKGILVHISLNHVVKNDIGFTLVPQQPPNQDEAENNPKLLAKADYRISWEKQPNGDYSALYPIIDKFIDFISDRIT